MTDETSPGIPTPDGAAAVIDTDYEIGQDNNCLLYTSDAADE